MEIIRVDLENVKSYKHESVRFTPGINAICGPNGAGKSTILEAVGFVLFNHLDPNQEQFVREGEKTASVTVHVTDEDGRRYEIVRKCGGYGRCYAYDPEIDQRITSGVGETEVWLHDFLGVDDRLSLSTLFKDAVGVPQGLLTSAFLESPSHRKDIFNPLLRVDEYDEAWDALLSPIRQLEKGIAAEEKRMAGLEAQVEGLAEWEQKAATHRSAIEADETAKEASEAEFNDVSEQKVRLEALKEQLGQIERGITAADAEVKTVAARLDDARKAMEVAEDARAVVVETQAAYQGYLAAEDALEALESERRERDRLKDESYEKQTGLAQVKQRANGLRRDLKEISEAEETMATLKPQVDTQERLEDQLQKALSRTERLSDAKQRLAEARGQLENLDDRITEMKAALEERAETEKQIEALKPSLETVGRQLETLSPQVASHRARLEQARAQATETRDRLVENEEKLQRERGRLKEMESTLSDVKVGLEELAEVENRIETLRAELDEIDERREMLSSRSAAFEVERAKANQQIQQTTEQLSQLAETLRKEEEASAGLEAKLSDIETLLKERAELDERARKLREEIETIRGQRDPLTSEIAATRREFDRLGRQMTVLEESEQATCPVCRKPLTSEHRAELLEQNGTRREELEASLHVLETRNAEEGETQQQKEKALREAEERVRELPRPTDAEEVSVRIKERKRSITDLEASMSEEREHLSTRKARLQEIEKALKESESQRREADELISRRQQTLNQLEKRIRDLPRAAEAEELSLQIEDKRHAVADLETSVEQNRHDLSAYQTQKDETAVILNELEAKQEDLKEDQERKRGRLASLEERAKELPRRAELHDITRQVEEQRQTVDETEARVVELSDAPEEVERLRAELDELDDPRRKYQLAADLAEDRESTEKGLLEAEERASALESEVGNLEERLVAYRDLDERVEIQRKIQEEYKHDYQRYMGHVREAETLEERRKKVAEQKEALIACQAECDKLISERDEVCADYDAEVYQQTKVAYDSLRTKLATLEERIRQTRNRLAEAQEKIDHLTKLQAKLDQARTEHNELAELLSLLRCLREVIKEAGPKVTQALVAAISWHAAQLYADIMADYTTRLRWTENYEILLTSEGRERGFNQLSGGEQMAAALAVRLALLKEISSINLAFFDEPTANLDDRRRDNLAEQILNVKGFSQLFVISHDDTFEQDTDHVVHVVKEDGRTRTIGD